MPQELSVYWADHDHGKYETNNTAGQVDLIDKSEMNEFENDECFGRDNCFKDTPQKYVCIRP